MSGKAKPSRPGERGCTFLMLGVAFGAGTLGMLSSGHFFAALGMLGCTLLLGWLGLRGICKAMDLALERRNQPPPFDIARWRSALEDVWNWSRRPGVVVIPLLPSARPVEPYEPAPEPDPEPDPEPEPEPEPDPEPDSEPEADPEPEAETDFESQTTTQSLVVGGNTRSRLKAKRGEIKKTKATRR